MIASKLPGLVLATGLTCVLGLTSLPSASGEVGPHRQHEASVGQRGPAAREMIAPRIKHRIRRHVMQQIKARFDANHDGVLDESERAAARQAIHAKLLERFDANHDGALDVNERQAARHAIQQKLH